MISSHNLTYLLQFLFNCHAVFLEDVQNLNVVLPMYFTPPRYFWMLHKLQNTHF